MCTLRSVLPTELVFQILYHSDPQDIIRWRTVSKWFHEITCDTALWKLLYERSSFPRPPGPFSDQSRISLERTLVKAMQLMRSWTTQPMRPVSRFTVKAGSKVPPAPPKLICGRWLVVCESARRLVLGDVDPTAKTHVRQVLWEHEFPTVSSWDVESVASGKGDCFVYVLLTLSHGFPPWYIDESSYRRVLEFRLNYVTGELYHSAAIRPPNTGDHSHDVKLLAANSRLLVILGFYRSMVLDTRTRTFYAFPPLRGTQGARVTDPSPVFIRSTFPDTSLVVLYHDRIAGGSLVQVLTLPPDEAPGVNGLRVLSPTHEGVIHDRVAKAKLARLTIDPATGTTNMKLIDCNRYRFEPQVLCIDLMFPLARSPAVQVLPITIGMRYISFARESVSVSWYEAWCQYVDVSDDGYIRGFCRGERGPKPRPWDSDPSRTSDGILKFTIDTTRDPWAVRCSPIWSAQPWSDDDPMVNGRVRDIVFDGMRGRLCYGYSNDIVVVDVE